MKILILGGTKFLGRYLAEAALARNHELTLFNRQQTNPDLFPHVEKLRGDRQGNLQALNGRTWDAVIDTCGYTSKSVRATAQFLAGSIGHYTFVSSASVYRNFQNIGLDESADVETLAPGAVEDENDSTTYGARKALCERAAEEAMPGRVLNVRPGIIVGPHDPTGRFLYWVLRAAGNEEMIAPGNPDARVQMIDVRDLAEWIVSMAESRSTGTFNAKGPISPLTFGQMLDQCIVGTRSNTRMTWVSDQFLLAQGVQPFSDLPFWLPIETHKGFFAVDCCRAIAGRLTCRPLIETVADTLQWSRDAQARCQNGLTPKRERDLLTAWRLSSAT